MSLFIWLALACAGGDAPGDDGSATDTASVTPTSAPDGDADGVAAADDCDDADPAVGAPSRHWPDADRDGHGAAGAAATVRCPEAGFAATHDDCDDADPDRFPGNPEAFCTLRDEDCDGLAENFDGVRVGGVVYVDAQAGVDAAPVDGVVEVCSTTASPLTLPRPVQLIGAVEGASLANMVISAPSGLVHLRNLGLSGSQSPPLHPTTGRPAGGCLQISGDADVTIEDVTFFACDRSASSGGTLEGGSIASAGAGLLTVRDATFASAAAGPGARGGALLLDGPAVLERVTFDRCASDGDGGAIWSASALTLTDVTFTDNAAEGSGGAIWSSGTTAATTATFTDNAAAGAGGAVAALGAFTATDAVFDGNTSDDAGGAVWVTGPTATITTSTFSGNAAAAGGGLWSSAPSLTLDSTAFAANTATVGGGLYLTGGGAASVAGSGLTLTDNAATGDGGAVWSDSTVTLLATTLERNAAGGAGGGLSQTGATLLVEDGVFQDNEAGTYGSALAAVATEVDLHDATLQTWTTTPYLWLHDATADLDGSVLTGPAPYSVASAVWMTGSAPHSTLTGTYIEVRDFQVYADGEGEDHTVVGSLMTLDRVAVTVGFGSLAFVTEDGSFGCGSGACYD